MTTVSEWKRIRVPHLLEMKRRGEKITMLTAYDYTLARLLERAGIEVILVGDSLGNVILGYETTLPVTLDDMIRHAQAVRRAVTRPLVVVDMPFMSYQVSVERALESAGRLMQEGGADAVKLEGGRAMAPVVRRLTEIGIPVMGHVGMTPQSVHALGGFRVQGRDAETAQRLLDDALALQEAGAFAVVLELVPKEVAARVTEALQIPTIGIGAGNACDGQVLVLHDMLGIDESTKRFVKRYANLAGEIERAVAAYIAEVKSGAFPADEHSFTVER